MDHEQTDLLVIGAGLAGLATANTALSPGAVRAIVLEGKGIGSNATTPLTFAETIREYDLLPATHTGYARFTFFSPDQAQSTHSFDESPLVALDYQRACAELSRRAVEKGGELIPERAVSLERHAGGWKVQTSSGRTILTRLVIDASGHSFFTAHCLNLPVPSGASHCFGARLKGCEIPDPGEVYFITPSTVYGSGGGWFYPLGAGRASFGIAVLRPGGQPYAGGDLRERFKLARETLQPFAQWIKNAEVEKEEWGIIPIYPLRRFTYNQLMLVGDSAGQATSWSCMGNEMALISGRMAGEVARAALQKNDTSEKFLRAYDQRWRARFGKIFRQAKALAPLVYGQTDDEWRQNLTHLQKLTPAQMVERMRTNWPQLPEWQLAWIVWYDRAGRARRRLAQEISLRLGRGQR